MNDDDMYYDCQLLLLRLSVELAGADTATKLTRALMTGGRQIANQSAGDKKGKDNANEEDERGGGG